MSDSCRIVADVLKQLRDLVAQGITTRDIDNLAETTIRSRGAEPAFKGYRGYPSTVCASINEQVVHGIPSGRKLKNGDIISIDIGVKYKGFYGDAAITVQVGSVAAETAKLVAATEESLAAGLQKALPGNRLSDISYAVQQYVESQGFSVVRSFVGHGIGCELHEEPQVPNYGTRGTGILLKPGMCLAIEPMINAGVKDVFTGKDGWAVYTKDRKPSAHFEHTIAITGDGAVILSTAGETVFD